MAILNYQPPMTPYLDILYRDDQVLVLNKPSGLLTVPGKAAEHKDSVQTRVQRVFPQARIVHRLDMATSGILLMAMNKDSHRHLSMQFERRQTEKSYLARVYGELTESTGSVELPLICDWPNRPKQMVDMQRGKAALTHWKTLGYTDGATTVELTPITGRSHQLRVHMLSLGHPILGDRLYAHAEALAMAPRLQLHAQQLSFCHPTSGETMRFFCQAEFDQGDMTNTTSG